jgi:hypothetical protein
MASESGLRWRSSRDRDGMPGAWTPSITERTRPPGQETAFGGLRFDPAPECGPDDFTALCHATGNGSPRPPEVDHFLTAAQVSSDQIPA